MGKGQSGTLGFPKYIEEAHQQWLNNNGSTKITYSAAALVNALSVPSGNPYEGFVLTDPSAGFNMSDQDVSAFRSRYNGDPSWTNLLTEVATKVGSVNFLRTIDGDQVNNSANSQASIDIAAAKAHLGQRGEQVLADQAFARGLLFNDSASIPLTTVDLDTAHGTSRVNADAWLAALGTYADTEGTETWAALSGLALGTVNGSGLTTGFSPEEILARSLAHANAALTALLTAANQQISAGALDAMVEAYRNRISYDRARRTRYFTGQMSDIGAVQSSAFVIGLGLTDAQTQADVAAYAAQIELDFRQRVFSSFVSLFQSASGDPNAALALRGNIFNGALGAIIQLVQTRASYRQGVLAQKGEVYEQNLTSRLGARNSELQQRGETLRSGAALTAQLAQARLNVETEVVKTHAQLFAVSLDAYMRTAMMNNETYHQVLTRSMEHRLSYQTAYLSASQAVASMSIEAQRMRYVAGSEHESRAIDLKQNSFLWRLNVLEKGANIMAAPGGMSGMMPNKSSAIGSALTGALGGAAMGAGIGAQIGAAGGPITALGGAGIGALVGAIGGLFG